LSNELLNLQKELREKTAKMNSMQTQLDHTEASLNTLRENHSKLIEQSTILSDAFKEEKRRSLQLEHEFKNINVNKTSLKEVIQ
jgi:chromosome segregation ATPase